MFDITLTLDDIIDIVLTLLIIVVAVVLTWYYIGIANDDNGGFDKKEFDRLVLYVMIFLLLALLVNGQEGLGGYFAMVLTYWLGRNVTDKVDKINIGKK